MLQFLAKYLGTSEYWPIERRVGWIVYAVYGVGVATTMAFTWTHQFENYWVGFKHVSTLLSGIFWPLYLLLKAGIWYWGA